MKTKTFYKKKYIEFLRRKKSFSYHPISMDIDSNHSLLYSLYNTIDIDELKYPMIMDTNIDDNTNQDGHIQDNYRYIIRKSLIRKKNKSLFELSETLDLRYHFYDRNFHLDINWNISFVYHQK